MFVYFYLYTIIYDYDLMYLISTYFLNLFAGRHCQVSPLSWVSKPLFSQPCAQLPFISMYVHIFVLISLCQCTYIYLCFYHCVVNDKLDCRVQICTAQLHVLFLVSVFVYLITSTRTSTSIWIVTATAVANRSNCSRSVLQFLWQIPLSHCPHITRSLIIVLTHEAVSVGSYLGHNKFIFMFTQYFSVFITQLRTCLLHT